MTSTPTMERAFVHWNNAAAMRAQFRANGVTLAAALALRTLVEQQREQNANRPQEQAGEETGVSRVAATGNHRADNPTRHQSEQDAKRCRVVHDVPPVASCRTGRGVVNAGGVA
jgi:hypothetical protein